jgi:beta-glucosidase
MSKIIPAATGGAIMNSDITGQVETLIRRMTLAQKIGQMVQTERMAITPEEVKEWHIGSVARETTSYRNG